jgi:hypothetical protein
MASVQTPLILSSMNLTKEDIMLNFYITMSGEFQEDIKATKFSIPQMTALP